MPTRDVEIVYTLHRGGQTLQEHTRWLAAEQAQRVDPPGPSDQAVSAGGATGAASGAGVHFIMDHQQHRAWLVNDNSHTVIDMAPPRQGPLDPASKAVFARRSEATIAGQQCTDWAVTGITTGTGAPESVLCLTLDGVLLRVQQGGQTLIEATSVTYAPSDPVLFQIPAQYVHTQPPK